MSERSEESRSEPDARPRLKGKRGRGRDDTVSRKVSNGIGCATLNRSCNQATFFTIVAAAIQFSTMMPHAAEAGGIEDRASASYPPPYLVEARIKTTLFRPGTDEPQRSEQGTLTLIQSNQWWEVEIDYGNPGRNKVKIANSKRIPGGVRTYHLFDSDERTGMTSAGACPVPHPAAGPLFDGWVSFSARPELPILDAIRIRRPLYLPICEMELVNAPENVGTYRARYLGPSGTFLASLLVTNRGWSLDIEVLGTGELGKRITELGTSFLDYEQTVLATTNLANWTFPTRVRARNYGFMRDARGVVPTIHRETEIRLVRVRFAPEEFARRRPIRSLYALDLRRPGSTGDGDGYVVTNDEWKPPTDRIGRSIEN